MDCCAQFNFKAAAAAAAAATNPISDSSSARSHQAQGLRFHPRAFRSFESLASSSSFRPTPLGFQCLSKICTRAPSLIISARAECNGYESSVGTPLEPQTPEGQFMCGILKNHPHIFSVAASEQLDVLATNRDNALARQARSVGSSESCLHERIAEMKELESQVAIEEVMYLMVVHNFYGIKVPMIPNVSKCTNDGRLEVWSSKVEELESIHGPEMLEMVREHVYNILRWKGSDTAENRRTIEINRLQLGRIYAASIMYGYFLKSASLRYHLERSLPSLHLENLVALRCSNNETVGGMEVEKLRGYMMGFDSKTLQLCAKLRSREAANLIEKHTWALFGEPEKKDDDDGSKIIAVSASGVRRLVLEAVAFGTFLWEVERYVDSVYRLKGN